jgi:peptidyl-prolyl cis-trans isomerase C
MQRIASTILIGVLLVAVDCIAQTQNAADEVLAENQWVKLTRADYELELMRVPEENRYEFAANPKRVTTLLNQVLVNMTLAKQARDAGLDRDPAFATRLAHEIDRFWAQAEVFKIEQDAGAEFDAHANDYLAKAREIYLIDKDKYRRPDEVSASHILFATAKHSDAAGYQLAKETRAKLAAGADFGTLARQLSDDPSAESNGGALGWFPASRMDPAFSKAAFGLKNVGDISEPVQSKFGYHVIRLDGRRAGEVRTFEQASKQIMAELRERYVKEAREARIDAIRTDPHTKVNQAAIDALVVKLPDVPDLPRTPPGPPPVK